MKRFFLIFVAMTIMSCSFDNKTGIWKDISDTVVDNKNVETIEGSNTVSRYEDVLLKNQSFNKEKKPIKESNIKADTSVRVLNWHEQFAISSNNISNFSYSDNRTIVSKGPKLSKFFTSKKYSNESIVFYNNKLISHDHKGTIFIYDRDLKKKVFEYNFYKKKFKKIDKKISLLVNNSTLYAADNLGYLYAINLEKKLLIWAKNYGIPFRSNLKHTQNQIFLANQDNTIYSINDKNGNKNWQFETGVTFIKSDFKNNFALDIINNNLFFLNTSGELYSLDYLKQKINWVLNFKNRTLSADTKLFLGQPLIFKNNNLIVSTSKAVLNYNTLNASRKWIFPATIIKKPIITSNYTYIITKDNLLVCLDNVSGKVVWSKYIYRTLSEKKIKKKNW